MDQQIWMGKFLKPTLLLIVVVGFLIRIWGIQNNPPELFSDEITQVLSARTIIETGKDVNGKFLPYFYNRLELYPPLYGYFAAISTYVFGLTTLSIRLPAVIFGVLTIVVMYRLSLILFGSSKLALFSAFLTAILPWQIHYSRIGWPSSLFLFFLLFPIYLFTKFVKQSSVINLYLATIFFAISIYSYRSAELFAPLILITLVIIYRQKVTKVVKHLLFAIILAIVILLPFFYTIKKEPNLLYGRPKKISTFSPGINSKSLSIFVRNYTAHLTPNFLFFRGDPNLRHGTSKNGVLFLTMAPLILIGIFKIFRNIKSPEYKFLLALFLIFPLGGSLTNDGVPHATRTIIGAPVFILLSTVGLGEALAMKKKYSLILLLSIVFLLSVEFFAFIRNYYKEYPKDSALWWEYGTAETLSYIKGYERTYQRACMENLNYWNEETFVNYYLPKTYIEIFAGTDNPDCLKPRTLVVTNPEAPHPTASKLLYVVPTLEGRPLWLIYGRE